MCKRHWKAINFPLPPPAKEDLPPPPEGESVYDSILPQSISYRPTSTKSKHKDDDGNVVLDRVDPLDPPPAPDGMTVMPLVSFLREGRAKAAGWHRNVERRARGMFPVSSLSSQLEPWERQLALVEILLLSGGTPFANFRDLSHAWGREKGFHHLLATSVCERRGEVERKKRSDAGRTMTPEQRKAFRDKLKRARLHKEGDVEDEISENMNITTARCLEIKTPEVPSPALEIMGEVAPIEEGREGNIVAASSSIEGSRISAESVSV